MNRSSMALLLDEEETVKLSSESVKTEIRSKILAHCCVAKYRSSNMAVPAASRQIKPRVV
jgi:hypothetical protein